MNQNLDIQGHRGCRGLYPENTIAGFKKALDLGVRTLEMDLVVSKDHKVVISHEPFFNHEISMIPDGPEITEDNERTYNLYNLDFSEIEKIDVGLKPHPRFAQQKKIESSKPLLSEMFKFVEEYKKNLGREVYYNIEIKRKPEQDNLFHPDVHTFIDLAMNIIVSSGCSDRVSVQCFDHKTLSILHQKYPNQKTVMLVEDIIPAQQHLEMLGFLPTIYSPNEDLVNPTLISYCHEKGMLVVPWTVNTAEKAEELINMGIDGIISDYPDMIIEVYESMGGKL